MDATPGGRGSLPLGARFQRPWIDLCRAGPACAVESRTVNVAEFQAKWRNSAHAENAAAQSHFIDVCRLLGHLTPTEADPDGRFLAFEMGVAKTGGGKGFADVWYRRHFAWEDKRPGADLDAAYRQLKLYAEALGNPPLLVVSDLHRADTHCREQHGRLR